MFEAIVELGGEARLTAERSIAYFADSLPSKLKRRLPPASIREFGALYATGWLAVAAGILDWRRERLLRAVTRCLKDAHRPSRSPSAEEPVRGVLHEQLRKLALPIKVPNQELGEFPNRGFRTLGTNCEYCWVNAEYFRSWFGNRPVEVETALRLLYGAGKLILPVRYGTDDFPGVAFVESSLKWNKRARKKTGFYKLAIGRRS